MPDPVHDVFSISLANEVHKLLQQVAQLDNEDGAGSHAFNSKDLQSFSVKRQKNTQLSKRRRSSNLAYRLLSVDDLVSLLTEHSDGKNRSGEPRSETNSLTHYELQNDLNARL